MRVSKSMHCIRFISKAQKRFGSYEFGVFFHKYVLFRRSALYLTLFNFIYLHIIIIIIILIEVVCRSWFLSCNVKTTCANATPSLVLGVQETLWCWGWWTRRRDCCVLCALRLSLLCCTLSNTEIHTLAIHDMSKYLSLTRKCVGNLLWIYHDLSYKTQVGNVRRHIGWEAFRVASGEISERTLPEFSESLSTKMSAPVKTFIFCVFVPRWSF